MENREEYRAAAHRSINKLFSSIDDMETKIDKAVEKGKSELRDRLKTLRKSREAVQERFRELEKASETTWKKAREGFENARDELQENWKDLKESIR